MDEDQPLQDVVDSEDEFDWEEVEVPEPHLEITLQVGKGKGKASPVKRKQGITHAERLTRINCHKIHTIALIVNARIRNRWLNDPLLHARLLSLVPLDIQNQFSSIHKSRYPDAAFRGRLFEKAMTRLATWWSESFFEVLPQGHLRNRTYDEIQSKLEIRGLHLPEVTIDEDTLEEILGTDFEIIKSPKSLMKHALNRCGSRDVSGQLFTALCRSLSIPARLMVSIQSVPWQAGAGKPKPMKGRARACDDGTETSQMSEGSEPKSSKARGKQKAQPPRMKRGQGRKLGRASPPPSDPYSTPPIFWTEVFSRADGKWLPVDPIRAIVNKRKVFDPTTTASAPAPNLAFPTSSIYGNSRPSALRPSASKVENRMLYVLAFEEDGYARDVTPRYATRYGEKVAKAQGGSSAPNIGGGGKGRQAWWDSVVRFLTRPYRLHRDDLEDMELETAQVMEGMPSTLAGFKDHPLYVLTRHLKQTEIIHPPPPETAEVGKFRGEPVYPRSRVVTLKTSENWLRSEGRSVREGEQPLKWIKYRAGTVNRMRELEVLRDELRVAGEAEPANGGEADAEIMQGLYTYSQTEAYVPPPVVDGIIPKNNFGNIDLYVPSMLPPGGVHLPYKGTAKIARKLGLDFAEAVTGFEFKKRRAYPILQGIVVAAENEDVILEAYREAEEQAREKAEQKRLERVVKRWTSLIRGLRIRKRLLEQYGKPVGVHRGEESVDPNSTSQPTGKGEGTAIVVEVEKGDVDFPMNFPNEDMLGGAERVVQAYQLPKTTGVGLPFKGIGKTDAQTVEEVDKEDRLDARNFVTFDLEEDEAHMDLDAPIAAIPQAFKTLEEMAIDAAASEVTHETALPAVEETVGHGAGLSSEAVSSTAVGGRTLRNRKVAVSLPEIPATGASGLKRKRGADSLTPASKAKISKKAQPKPKGKGRAKNRRRRADDYEDESEDDGESQPDEWEDDHDLGLREAVEDVPTYIPVVRGGKSLRPRKGKQER